MVEGIADAFARFINRYCRFFRSKTRDSAAVTGRYLRGLAQADDCTFAAMATVVDAGCAQQFQHFISNAPWDHKLTSKNQHALDIVREVKSEKTIKYNLSNTPVDTPVLRLAQMQRQRYWVERTVEDAKGECGLAAWHHHVTMVMPRHVSPDKSYHANAMPMQQFSFWCSRRRLPVSSWCAKGYYPRLY